MILSVPKPTEKWGWLRTLQRSLSVVSFSVLSSNSGSSLDWSYVATSNDDVDDEFRVRGGRQTLEAALNWSEAEAKAGAAKLAKLAAPSSSSSSSLGFSKLSSQGVLVSELQGTHYTEAKLARQKQYL